MTSRRCTRSTRALGVGSALALIGSSTTPARADDAEETLLGLGIAVLAVTDITFSVRDIVAVARDEHPGFAWSLTEAIVTTPQAIGFGVATGVLAADDNEDDATLGTLLIAPAEAWVATLGAHGLWGSIDKGANPGGLFGVSPVIGGNFALTLIAVSNTAVGRWSPLGPAMIETLGAIPGSVLGAYHTATDPDDRGLWIGLTAWSGALFVHGLISSIVGGVEGDDYDEESTPPPPPPPPPPGPSPAPLQPEPEKPPMVKAARWVVVPTTLQDVAGQRAPAVSVAGQLW